MSLGARRGDWTRLNILYVGPACGTSLERADALRRLGCSVSPVDPWDFLPGHRVFPKILQETGSAAFDSWIAPRFSRRLNTRRYDLAWVNGGELMGPGAVEVVKAHASRVINYNNDNPFTTRDKRKWRLYEKSLPLYDLVVVVHETSVKAAREAGAREVLRVYLSADEVNCAPRRLSAEELDSYSSDVVFVGTWMPERGLFMAELVERGVPLSIWGDRWQKAPEWNRFRRHWRGPGLWKPSQYAAALTSSRVGLGLVSNENFNLHTDRSIQIPALGTLLCAQRTTEHMHMYEEDTEAVFWDDAEECAAQCHALLADDPRREAVACAGHDRCLRNGYFNEPVLSRILARILGDASHG